MVETGDVVADKTDLDEGTLKKIVHRCANIITQTNKPVFSCHVMAYEGRCGLTGVWCYQFSWEKGFEFLVSHTNRLVEQKQGIFADGYIFDWHISRHDDNICNIVTSRSALLSWKNAADFMVRWADRCTDENELRDLAAALAPLIGEPVNVG